jgi:hypothetical protein
MISATERLSPPPLSLYGISAPDILMLFAINHSSISKAVLLFCNT